MHSRRPTLQLDDEERGDGFSCEGTLFEIAAVRLRPGAAEPRRRAAGSPGRLVTRAHDDRAGWRVGRDVDHRRHDAILVRVAP